MILGIDFDNTIINYNNVFHHVSTSRGLIPSNLPASKGEIRDYLRKIDREDDWTEMQGYVYGSAIEMAQPFPGVLDFFKMCRDNRVTTYIVSHKTRYPYRGPEYDLHKAALQWLNKYGFFDSKQIGLPEDRVFFEISKSEKMQRIRSLSCTHFIDDLPEFLAEPEFPQNVKRYLFDPNCKNTTFNNFEHVTSWPELISLLLN